MPIEVLWWFLLGAITWAVSVGVKIVLSGVVDLGIRTRWSDTYYATIQGLLSAITELGAAALVFMYILPKGTLLHASAFGAGAGIIEALILFAIGYVSQRSTKGENEEKKMPWYQEWTFVVERFGAILGHIGSRGLVWLSVYGPAYPFVLALIAFSSVDGIATYGVLKKWNWFETKIWRRFYGFVIFVGSIEVVLFLVLSVFLL